MLKVMILDRCHFCDGEAYIHLGEYRDGDVQHPVYQPCPTCQGTGEAQRAVSLQTFAELLARADALEPDWAALAQDKPLSQTQADRDAAGL